MPKADSVRELNPESFVHIYKKDEAKQGRKMGHATLLNEDREKLVEFLQSSGMKKWQQLFD